jgi:hypothetical protein
VIEALIKPCVIFSPSSCEIFLLFCKSLLGEKVRSLSPFPPLSFPSLSLLSPSLVFYFLFYLFALFIFLWVSTATWSYLRGVVILLSTHVVSPSPPTSAPIDVLHFHTCLLGVGVLHTPPPSPPCFGLRVSYMLFRCFSFGSP